MRAAVNISTALCLVNPVWVQTSVLMGAEIQAVADAFSAAKRAVLRCGGDGDTLPVEKNDQWRDIELRFDPERTRSK
jgi:hypothetical protein